MMTTTCDKGCILFWCPIESASLEEIIQRAFKPRLFYKDKANAVNVRPGRRFTTSTERAGIIKMKTTVFQSLALVLFVAVVSRLTVSLGSDSTFSL